MVDLLPLLLETGLIQFGRFGGDYKPFQLHFDLLPSYPDVLNAIVQQAGHLVGEVDHLVCVNQAIPFGVGLSLKTGIPLVYSWGSDEPPVYDLVGAYDIGHPSILLANHSDNMEYHARLVDQSRQVGLEIDRLLVIIATGKSQKSDLEVLSLLKLELIVDELAQSGELPEGQVLQMRQWLNKPG